MANVVVLVGVPASGKTHVCERLGSAFKHVPHDKYIRGAYLEALVKAARGRQTVVAEAPFNAAELLGQLQSAGLKAEEWLVTDALDAIKARYASRAGKAYPANFETNHGRYNASQGRFKFKGTATEVLTALKAKYG